MKRLFAAAAIAATSLASQVSAQSLPCEDYDTVMGIFAEQGTIYRGTAEGPNHFLVEIFENVATGRGIAIHHDRDNSRACVQAAGFDYKSFSERAVITPPPAAE